MKIFTFVCEDPALPVRRDKSGAEKPPLRAIARIWCPMVGVGGKAVDDWHPVICRGETAEAAREAAAEFWRRQVVEFQAMTPRQRDIWRKSVLAREEAGIAFDGFDVIPEVRTEALTAASTPAAFVGLDEVEEAV